MAFTDARYVISARALQESSTQTAGDVRQVRAKVPLVEYEWPGKKATGRDSATEDTTTDESIMCDPECQSTVYEYGHLNTGCPDTSNSWTRVIRATYQSVRFEVIGGPSSRSPRVPRSTVRHPTQGDAGARRQQRATPQRLEKLNSRLLGTFDSVTVATGESGRPV